ncbi:NERD domain-containing protein [Acetobacter sacchari]|uniref:NERD domain-containing protein n=1 Tax=Acetobacter sacchari TaxID=2661687 RepID=A0ABS3LWN5_9PROT|nr:nuclease-related domain-containing protein [Acetobacter sacchari]MBO1360293.1 NERD domain-containing protein [Acetobacter sacchari]
MGRRFRGSAITAREYALLQALKADIQGQKGESEVRTILADSGLACRHDLVLPTRQGTVTQIDHVAMVPAGIMVIETKRLRGRISGDPRDDFWKQSLPGGWEGQVYSPVRQNAGHCEAVYATIRHVDPGIQVLSRIVLTGNVEIAPQLAGAVFTSETLRGELDALRNQPVAEPIRRAWTRLSEAALAQEGLRSGTTRSPFSA